MLRRFFSQALLYHRARTSAFDPAEFLFLDAGYPVVTLIFYCLLAAYSFQTAELAPWVVGNAFLMCTNTCIFSLGSTFTSERQSGRLRSILAAPCSMLGVVLSCGFFPMLTAAAAVVCGFLVGGAVFGVDFSGLPVAPAGLVILCAMVSASCFGLLMSVLGLLTDSMNMVLNVFSYVLMIFTGAEFPVSQLPAAGQLLSRLLPLTRSIAAMDCLLTGSGSAVALAAGELLLAAVYAGAAVAALDLAQRACRRSGRFDLF